MNLDNQIKSLEQVGVFLKQFLDTDEAHYNEEQRVFSDILRKSEIENPWFTIDNLKFAIESWCELLTEQQLKNWLSHYQPSKIPKRIGLILAGNIPLVGFHDVISVVLSGHIPVIKLSSKARLILPFILNYWNKYAGGTLDFEFIEKLENYEAVIATGSNNTARYLEYYFRDKLSIIRKNRTSVAVLSGNESDEELRKLAKDIFTYFGLGCRNVTRLFIPKDFTLDRLFENFMEYSAIINHHKYANNYDYNKAVYLLNRDDFWDNNFVMLREDMALFSPLSVVNFSRYEDLESVKQFLSTHQDDIQCIVAQPNLIENSVNFGEAQKPSLSTYADNVDTMKFLEVI